eukprot:CAMPEP_0197196340 /NCGR_PEP_ID=MMETSP1423-20130617/32305_1 /TAXON_ID=476441 /ORGANISM="Pseudo-nitzschia heimii, Strain UNC1101" /LENGTH=459 /DNA_ID=CAMNT_0042650135 /DNA_START=107 /DNA_END=1486 /DNA_ORIENTATION=-
MFRRLADRVSDAVSSATSSLSSGINATSEDSRVSQLAAMGFREAEAMHALRVAGGDLNRATEWLLTHGSPVGSAGNPVAIPPDTAAATAVATEATSALEDSELQRAIQASLMTEQQTKDGKKQQRQQSAASKNELQRAIQASLMTEQQTKDRKKQQRQQSAASKNAGLAAASRLTTKSHGPKTDLASTHPKVQMPKRISQHDQEDIIMRCANRVAPYSLSVDTLLRSLKTIQANPSNRKYHTVDTSSAMFQRSLSAPGVLDFLKAVNFHPNYDNRKILTLSHFDGAAFYLGISSLEQIQQKSTDYRKDKALRGFQKDMASFLSEENATEEELSARTKLLSKLPSEPSRGGSQITVEYGVVLNTAANAEAATTPLTKISRGFDHDDTLVDVLHWLGGQATGILAKLEIGDWSLVDRNRQGPEEDHHFYKLDLRELRDQTLQRVGCWPSGRLAIVPALTLG